MKYYKHWTEEIGDNGGLLYQEIDWDQDMVLRQVEVVDDAFEWGEWTGIKLEGRICDQRPSGFTPLPSSEEEITSEEFETVWRRAKQNPSS